MSINDKIKQVLTVKNLSPSYLADDIGVQRSSISHILSGRNRPSLDIIQKIVRRFPEFTYEWFLDSDLQIATDELPTNELSTARAVPTPKTMRPPADSRPVSASSISQPLISTDENKPIVPKKISSLTPSIDRILVFYSDGTFREYSPA